MTNPDEYPVHLIDASHALTGEQINAWLAEVWPVMCQNYPDRTRRWFATANQLLTIVATANDQQIAAAQLAQLAAELLLRQAERIPTLTPQEDTNT